MKTFISLLTLSRPVNLLFILLVQLLVIFKVLQLPFSFYLSSIIVATQFITAAGYILNDYFDTKTDAINKPNRIIIGREVKRSTVLSTILTLNISSLFLMLYHTLNLFGLCGIIIFLLWIYSYSLKKVFLVGNVLVAVLTIAPIYILTYNSVQESYLVLTIICGFVFMTNLIREIIKDCEDVEGDKTINAKTLPIVLGLSLTKGIVTCMLFLFNLFTWKICSLSEDIFFYIPSILISLLSIYITYFLYKTVNNFTKASLSLKLLMLVGCLSILFL